MIESSRFRSAMSRLGAAVNIITTDGAAGRHGMTASAVCSVTDEPASLLVCINRSSKTNEAIGRNGVLCVNVLSGGHEELSGRFASKALTTAERFAGAEWDVLDNGAPALVGALCSLGCIVESVQIVGTHSIIVGRVTDLRSAEGGDGLIYFGRAYHRLSSAAYA